MTEQWRAIKGYPNYEVSDHGRVRRTTSRTCAKAGSILSTRGLRSGYPSVDLVRDGKRRTWLVHQLVAAAFLAPVAGKPEVNHIDAVKTNNLATNLEYVTRAENEQHAHDLGLQDCAAEHNGFAKLTWTAVGRIREIAARPDRPSYCAIAAEFGVNEGTIRAVVSGKTWRKDAAAGR